ncbi:IMPACT family member YigZ [Planctomycetes bacterium Pla86]|uniref:IMPACT family member YigZ n=1 Tax=Engelhardtia mirabilis TaxID=2528011 RepID=A0A518BLD6_9BACT|nr:IMPACT family member YigZ [Planctomycetes bacterium Pla133]QDV02115.1 IMPACT family member YigZ [Planctomycetes bacterium Pla86]
MVAASHFEDDPIKGSRFIADVIPAAEPDRALEAIEGVRAVRSDARHHCWAWRLDPEGREVRSNDDGEPGNSAGAPILRQIEGHDLCGLVVVVTRYFGGVKLGVGGLIRAYGGAAGRALDRARVVERAVLRRLSIRYPYEVSGAVEGALARNGAIALRSEYGAEVAAELSVPIDAEADLRAQLRDASAGRVRIAPLE